MNGEDVGLVGMDLRLIGDDVDLIGDNGYTILNKAGSKRGKPMHERWKAL